MSIDLNNALCFVGHPFSGKDIEVISYTSHLQCIVTVSLIFFLCITGLVLNGHTCNLCNVLIHVLQKDMCRSRKKVG